jgi:hypothetical protein
MNNDERNKNQNACITFTRNGLYARKITLFLVYRPDDTLKNQQGLPECIKNLVKKCLYKNWVVYKINFKFS